MKKSETWKRERKDEAVAHLSPTGAASIQPWWSSSSQWERHRHGSRSKFFKGNSAKALRCSIGQRQPLRCTYRREEKEETKKRKSRERGRRAAKRVQPAPGRDEGFASGSVFDSSHFSRHVGEGDGNEFNSPRKGGGERGRHLRSRSRTSIHSPIRQQQQQPPHGDGLP